MAGHPDHRFGDAVRLHVLAVFHRGPKDLLVPRNGGVQIVHGNRHVVNLEEQ